MYFLESSALTNDHTVLNGKGILIKKISECHPSATSIGINAFQIKDLVDPQSILDHLISKGIQPGVAPEEFDLTVFETLNQPELDSGSLSLSSEEDQDLLEQPEEEIEFPEGEMVEEEDASK